MVAKKAKKRSQGDALISALEIQKRLRFSGAGIGAVIAIDPPSIEQLEQSAIGYTAIGVGTVSAPDPKDAGPETQLEFNFNLRRATEAFEQQATGSIQITAPTTKTVSFIRHVFATIANGLSTELRPTYWGGPDSTALLASDQIEAFVRGFVDEQMLDPTFKNAIISDSSALAMAQAASRDQAPLDVTITQDGNIAALIVTLHKTSTGAQVTTTGKPSPHVPQEPIASNIQAPFVMQARDRHGNRQWILQYVLDSESLENRSGTRLRIVAEVAAIAEEESHDSERRVS